MADELTFRGMPVVFLWPRLSDAAEKAGVDMRPYRKQEPIPLKAK
jgi:hypothetical protein